MICLETSFLVDYLEGTSYTRDFLEARPTDEAAPRIPTVAFYELYAGAVRSASPSETINTVVDALRWAEPLVFDDPAAREAAMIRVELLERGEPIPGPDMLIAGAARAGGYELVTTDPHFDAVDELDVLDPRP